MTLHKERKTLGSVLGLVLLATALTGCGGDEPEGGPDATATESSAAGSEETTEGEEATEGEGAPEASGEEVTGQAFCTAVDDAFVLEDQTEFIETLKAITPPAELATDWSVVVTAMEGMVVEGQGLESESAEDTAKLEALLTKYSTPEVEAASAKIDDYEAANCTTGTE